MKLNLKEKEIKSFFFKQVSVATATHKHLAKGRTSVKLYDDDSYSALRKVSHLINYEQIKYHIYLQARTDDAIKSVKPFGEVELNHPV